MEGWIGPAIITAAISAIITVLGWLVAHRRERRMEVARRREKVRDFQSALLAEIVANGEHFSEVNLDEHAADILAQFAEDATYTPFVPRDASTIVLDTILPDLYILPSPIVEPAISYYKQLKIVSHFIDDLKGSRYPTLSPARRKAMYIDYIRMIKKSRRQGAELEAITRRSLGDGKPISSPASGLMTHPERDGAAEASGRASENSAGRRT